MERSKARILIVDDVADTVSGIREALVRRGFSPQNIVSAYSKGEAESQLKEAISEGNPFDLVTVDLYMNQDLWAGLKVCDYLGSLRSSAKVIVYSVIYSRFRESTSVYAKEEAIGAVNEQINRLIEGGVVSDALSKNKKHDKLVDRIETLLDITQ